MVVIDQFLEELCPLRDFTVFRTFFLSAYRYSFDIWYTALPYQDSDQVWVWFWSINFSRSYGPWTLKKISNYQFYALFFLIFVWYLVHCFAIPRYRSTLSLVLIHWIFTKLWPLDLEKKSQIISFPEFFFSSLLTDIHLIFFTLICHTKIQIKFEFGFDPLIFHEVMTLWLTKISRIISFLDFFSLCLQILI
jgi:hypothetical protein